MDLYRFVDELVAAGEFDAVRRNPVAQFGTPNRQYLGATIFPEREVEFNNYEETDVRVTTVIAAEATRYSPVQIREAGQLFASFNVSLGHSNIGRNLRPKDYDALVRLVGKLSGASNNRAGISMQAAGILVGFSDAAVNEALVQVNERQRWQMIEDGSVIRRNDAGTMVPITYPTPSGHRVVAGGDWADAGYDPMTEMLAKRDFLAGKGRKVARIIWSTAVQSLFMANTNVKRRAGAYTVFPVADSGGGPVSSTEYARLLSLQQLSALFGAEGLPTPETYDQTYTDARGTTARFMSEDVMVMICQTDREEIIESTLDPEDIRFLPNVAGYTAVGVCAGQEEPGRVILVQPRVGLPPHIKFQGAQTSIPVMQDPEAVLVVRDINIP